MKRRTEIILEVKEIFFTKRSRATLIREWCPVCAAQRRMVSPEEAAALTRHSVRAIYRLVEEGGVHYVQRKDGLISVCLDSLPQPLARR